MPAAQAQLELFLAKYRPDVGETRRAAIAHLRARLPTWDVLEWHRPVNVPTIRVDGMMVAGD